MKKLSFPLKRSIENTGRKESAKNLFRMNKWLVVIAVFCFTIIPISSLGNETETIGIFRDSRSEQLVFAAQDIKYAIELHGLKTEVLDIGQVSVEYPNRKVVIAMQSDDRIMKLFEDEGDIELKELGKQSFSIYTSEASQKSYWMFGGDENGAMYGGLQLAENFELYGMNEKFEQQESPHIMNRGVKFNIPFDKRSPTYYGSGFSENDFRGTSTKKAVQHVWDINFWTEYFDELARNRFNAISLWSPHPFTSMVKLDDYPDAAIKDVEGFEGFSKSMSIDEKITFWKQVMILAKNRGIEVYIYNWNIYTYGATGKYGIDNDAMNKATIEYMRKSIVKLFETYPLLKGFGVTAGENMGDIDNDTEAKWMWDSYGRGIYEYAMAHPGRNIVFIHRYHGSGAKEVADNFQPLLELANVRFDFSFKYAVAHIYSTATPNFIRTRYGDVPEQLGQLGLKTWLELRNDDFYYLHWGDPDFVRRYLAGFPDKDKYIRGFFMGSDGYTPTYVFNNKAEWADGKLEIQRFWYMHYLWGRLAFNVDLSNDTFKEKIAAMYPTVSADTLFTAWQLASKGLPLMTELIQGTWKSDFLWYPEACMSRRYGFITIDRMPDAVPPPGSDLCSIAETAANNCGDKKSALEVSGEMELFAQNALSLIRSLSQKTDTEVQTNIGNIRAMSYLSLYYAQKIRGSVHLAAGRKEKAKQDMSKAVEYWLLYSHLMDEMYKGMDLQRNNPIPDWHFLDEEVKAEFTKLIGIN